MSSHAQKFTFGDDFGIERRGGPVRRAQDRAIAEEAEQRGYASGFAAGLAAQSESDESRMAEALAALAGQLTVLEQQKVDFFAQCEKEAVALALSLADLHGQRIAGFDPHAGFAAAVHDVMTQFPAAARLVARVALRDAIEARLMRLGAEARFEGRLIVEALPEETDACDFALEWPDGVIRHDRGAISRRLQDEFQRFGFSLPDMNDHG